MSIRNDNLGGTDWSDGESATGADLNDTFDATIKKGTFIKQSIYTAPATNGYGLVKFSDSIWITNVRRTTDSGATWSSYGGSGNFIISDGTKGFYINNSGSAPNYTTDSGATWTASTTAPANVDAIFGLAQSGDTIVMGGTASSGDGVWYSTDGGDNWTQGSSGGAALYYFTMVDSTTGYATAGGNIYKTTDSGANWTDTTHAFSSVRYIYAIDATNVLGLCYNGRLQKYDDTAGTVTQLCYGAGISGYNKVSNIVSDGTNYYWIKADYALGDASYGLIYRTTVFKYDGTNIYSKVIGQEDITNYPNGASSDSRMPILIYASGYIYLNTGYAIITIPVE